MSVSSSMSEALADARDHLVRVEIDADRVLVAGRAVGHVVAGRRGRCGNCRTAARPGCGRGRSSTSTSSSRD